MKRHTPWGFSQHVTEKNEDIEIHSTASHGGIYLSDAAFAHFKERFPWFETYAGGQWFEEDQDWAMVALAYPGSFSTEDIRQAVRTARSSAKPFDFGEPGKPSVQRYPKWELVVEWLDTHPYGKMLCQRVADLEAEKGDHWEPGSRPLGQSVDAARRWGFTLSQERRHANDLAEVPRDPCRPGMQRGRLLGQTPRAVAARCPLAGTQ